jgi:hypothetical protein
MNNIYEELIHLQDKIIEDLEKENKKLEKIATSLLVITLLLLISCLILIFNP